MATCLFHGTRAARLIGVLAEGEQLNANQTADMLTALQSMLASWESEGVPLSGLVGATLASGTELPLPPTHDDAVQFNLAVMLAPEYGVQPSPVVMDRADKTFRVLQGAYASDITMVPELALLRAGRNARVGFLNE